VYITLQMPNKAAKLRKYEKTQRKLAIRAYKRKKKAKRGDRNRG
jgi:hypothetical protein